MNKGYSYIDGKVIVSDENGIHKLTDYYDNFEQVLVQENLIEAMDKKIRELNEMKKNNPVSNKKFKPIILYVTFALLLIIPAMCVYFMTGQNPYLVNFEFSFGSVNLVAMITAFTGLFALPFSIIYNSELYSIYKTKMKNANGINSELEYLEKQIVIEKEKLNLLQQNKTRNNENKEFRSARVDDKKKMYALNDKLNLYFSLGACEKRLYSYYKKGKLEKKLRKYYDKTNIELAKEYLREKESVLVRKKTRSRH